MTFWSLPHRFLFLLLLSLYGRGIVESAPLLTENSEYNVNRAVGVLNPIHYYGEWPGHIYHPSPIDWRNISIYQVITDRFRDGEPTNNEGQFGGYAPGEVYSRHGGDFRGLTEKLDYIKGLGFDAIWISPIFQNHVGSPAGYGQMDFTLLDDRFGTLDELRQMVTEAHSRNMYVIADIVVNHLSYLYYPEGYKGRSAPFRMHTGEYRMLPRYEGLTYLDFQVDNKFIAEGTFCDVYGHDGKKYVDTHGQGSFWNSDIHHNGGLNDYYDPWSNHLGNIYNSLNDLRLCSTRVQQKIISMSRALISSTDIDGIRLDTPMQVPLGFFKVWTPAVKKHADSLGKNNFFIFGETYSHPKKAATLIGRGKTPEMYGQPELFIDQISSMDSGIDYGFYKTFIEPLFRELDFKPVPYFQDFITAQDIMYDLFDPLAGRKLRRMLIFYDNHDQRRLSALPDGIRRSRLAALMISFWPGIPLSYHGSEQDFSSFGIALDGHARENMSTSIAWVDHPSQAASNKASNDNFDMVNGTYLFMQRLMQLRKMLWHILEHDEISFLWSLPQNPGTLLSFSRLGESNEALQIVLNISDKAASKDVRRDKLATVCKTKCLLIDLLNDNQQIETDKDGYLQKLQLEPFSGKLLYHGSGQFSFAPRVIEILPSHDAVIPLGEADLQIRFDKKLDIATLAKSLRFNGLPIDRAKLRTKDNLQVTFTVAFKDGLNHLHIDSDAMSPNKQILEVPFTARFRSGTQSNVIVDPLMKREDSLINQGANFTREPKVKLHHKAKGAKFLRVKNEPNGLWSPWTSLQEFTDWSIDGSGPGWRKVTVQYWADGSASYYVSDGIDYVLPDGIPITDLNSARVTQ